MLVVYPSRKNAGVVWLRLFCLCPHKVIQLFLVIFLRALSRLVRTYSVNGVTAIKCAKNMLHPASDVSNRLAISCWLGQNSHAVNCTSDRRECFFFRKVISTRKTRPEKQEELRNEQETSKFTKVDEGLCAYPIGDLGSAWKYVVWATRFMWQNGHWYQCNQLPLKIRNQRSRYKAWGNRISHAPRYFAHLMGSPWMRARTTKLFFQQSSQLPSTDTFVYPLRPS